MPHPSPTRDAVVLALSIEDNLCAEELSERTGRSAQTIRRCIRESSGLIHVSRYERVHGRGGKPVPYFTLRQIKDAKPPRINEKAERKRRSLRHYHANAAYYAAQKRAKRGKSTAGFWDALL